MTRSGYYFLLGLLVLVAVGGAVAAAPTKLELGLVETVSCEEWWSRPITSDPVRIEGCKLAISQSDNVYRPGSALVPVRPAGWEPDDPPEVFWLTTDSQILALVHRLESARMEAGGWGDQWRVDYAYRRVLERYSAELSAPRAIVGTPRIDGVDGTWEVRGREVRIVDGTPKAPQVRAMGIVLLALALLGIAVLVPLQRRWERRRAQLTGNAQPLRF